MFPAKAAAAQLAKVARQASSSTGNFSTSRSSHATLGGSRSSSSKNKNPDPVSVVADNPFDYWLQEHPQPEYIPQGGKPGEERAGGLALMPPGYYEAEQREKGNRPPIHQQLTKAQQDHQLRRFSTSKFVSKFTDGPPQFDTIGRSGGKTFVMPSSDADFLVKICKNVSDFEKAIGVASGTFRNLHRVDIPITESLQLSTGNEEGANEFWRPGGYAGKDNNSRIAEGVIDSVPSINAKASKIQFSPDAV